MICCGLERSFTMNSGELSTAARPALTPAVRLMDQVRDLWKRQCGPADLAPFQLKGADYDALGAGQKAPPGGSGQGVRGLKIMDCGLGEELKVES
jgi:hypothetical protein